jgi:hypothetical protein
MKAQNYDRRYKRIQKSMDNLEAKYPNIDLRDSVLRHDVNHYGRLMNELVYAKVNADACKSENPDQRCETCECWKKTRANSM